MTVLAVGLPWLWLGMVTAISLLETPLKFRAPGITPALAVGIGRLVFRALHWSELVIVIALAAALASTPTPRAAWAVAGAAAVILAGQALVLRPRLDRRAAEGGVERSAPRPRTHGVYVAAEITKIVVLVTLAVVSTSAATSPPT